MASNDSLLADLQQHLRQVSDDPGQRLNEKLLDECAIFLPPNLSQKPRENAQLVSQISSLSPGLQQDPTPLIRVLEKLVQPFSFADVLSLQPPVDFAGGLNVEALPYNRIMLQLLRKAAASSKDLSALANMQSVVKALINLWLTTNDVGVAEEAASVILVLLDADLESNDVAVHGIGQAGKSRGGSGLFWRRMFDDKDLYSLMFTACGPEAPRKERSLAQARLMSLAPKIGALDWPYLARSHQPEVEKRYGLDPTKEGLLDFIAVHMTDHKGDVLLHINVIHFFSELLTLIKLRSSDKDISVSLQFLRDRKLHDRSLSYWLLPNDPSHDPLDLTFLSGPVCIALMFREPVNTDSFVAKSARYMSTFATECPNAFLQEARHPQVLHRLSRALSVSAGQWAQGQSPKHDLNVLVSLPRTSLLPQAQLGIGRQSTPLLLVPCKNTNTDALNTLATVFKGPTAAEPASTPSSLGSQAVNGTESHDTNEAAAARATFSVYYVYNDNLFSDLVDHANIVALPEKAIAAMNLISSIANANWAPLPTENSFNERESPTSLAALPNEAKLQTLLPATSKAPDNIAASGIEALLQSPAREQVFPFLLRPPQTFTYLVGGRGDPESNAYKVANGKWDCLVLIQKKLAELVGMSKGGEQARNLLSAIGDRVREGVWGQQTAAGNQIASLEM